MASHFAHLPAHLDGAFVHDGADVLLVDSGVPTDTFNAVCRARLPDGDADRGIAWAIGHFRAKGFPFSWWVGPSSRSADLGERLIARGLSFAEAELGMTCALSRPLERAPAPPGLEIRRAETRSDLRDYAAVIAAIWDPPNRGVVDVYERASAAALASGSPARYYIGYLDGDPVAASECFLAHGVAGIYNVVTLPSARRRGIGTALTAAALRGARREGYRTATLQASAQGRGVYAQLGFVALGEFREYR